MQRTYCNLADAETHVHPLPASHPLARSRALVHPLLSQAQDTLICIDLIIYIVSATRYGHSHNGNNVAKFPYAFKYIRIACQPVMLVLPASLLA